MLRTTTLRACAALLLGSALLAPAASAQVGDGLNLYGFFQTQLRYSQENQSGGPEEILSFSVQQLNFFGSTQLTQEFSAFVNAEITNSFSSETGFGTLRLEEAWMRYNNSAALNVKAGLLVPTFNNLNEIKNRTPLLPYVFRPLAYETSFASVLPTRALVPEQAFLQVNGTVPTGPVRVDYAAYVGNSESAYAAPVTTGSIVAGTDTTTSKLVGGRLGLRWRSLKAGVSGSFDERNLQNFNLAGTLVPINLGDVGRTRVGADVSFERGRLFGEAEAIAVLYSTDAEQDATLAFLATNEQSPLRGLVSNGLDQRFYYALLGVNVTDRLFAWGMYNYLEDTSQTAFANGFDSYGAGLGFRPIFPIVVKAQYGYSVARENVLTDYSGHFLFLAASVQF